MRPDTNLWRNLSDNKTERNSSEEGINFLREVIKESLSDDIITPKEYSMIRLVANHQGITDSSEIDKIIYEIKNSIV